MIRSQQQKLNHVRVNTDLILSTELSLPNELVESINKFEMLDLSTHVEIDTYDFIKPLHNLCIEAFLKFDPTADIKTLLRVLLTKSVKNVFKEDNVHRDYDFLNYWSFLIHLKGNDGNTAFYDSIINPNIVKSFPFKPYTLIMFPSLYAHQGYSPTTVDRYAINFIMEVESSLNKDILKNSSSSIFK